MRRPRGGDPDGIALNCTFRRFASSTARTTSTRTCPRDTRFRSSISRWPSMGTSSSSLGETRRAGRTRVHVEEDTGRLSIALARMASEVSPSIQPVRGARRSWGNRISARQRRHGTISALRQILRYIGVSTGNMEEAPSAAMPTSRWRPTAHLAPRSKSRT